MKKELNILRLILVVSVVLVVIVSLFVFFALNNRVEYNELVSVSITRSNAFARVDFTYTLSLENGVWIATYSDTFFEEPDELVVDDAFANEIKKLLKENRVHKWDGFDVEREYIYDASSIYFSMRFSDGKEIKAHGYAASPRNFSDVFSGFEKRYEPLFAE